MNSRSRVVPGLAVIAAVVTSSPLAADVIHVPADHATIQEAIAVASDGDEIVVGPGVHAGFDFNGRTVTVRSSDGPAQTRLVRGGGSIVVCVGDEGPGTRLEGFKLSGAVAEQGGGVYARSDLVIANCVFSDNVVVAGGGGVNANNAVGEIRIEDCVFRENSAGGGGGIFGGSEHAGYSLILLRCSFIDNEAIIGGGIDLHSSSGQGIVRISHCVIMNNSASLGGGGVTSTIKPGGDVRLTNCVLAGNSSVDGAGLIATGPVMITNCTIARNLGLAVHIQDVGSAILDNCILWDNADTTVPGLQLSYCVVEGGASGPGNVDADPLFVQPGAGDFRLLDGSPALDAGLDALIGPDLDDLDGDGDTDEAISLDLAGDARVLGPAVDCGPYEGVSEPSNPTAAADDLDPGELVVLVPGGGAMNPVANALVMIANLDGAEDAGVSVSLLPAPPSAHDAAVEIVDVITVQTALADGTHRTTVMIPFRETDLQGREPWDMVLLAARTGEAWAPAVDGNLQPGGHRIEVLGPAPFGITQVVGDHGVYWNLSSDTPDFGFAWANVDYDAGDFAVGFMRPCLADATDDAVVDGSDLSAVMDGWGTADPWSDLDGDGVVTVMDIVRVITGWQSCP